MTTINTIIRSVELHKEHLLKLIKQKECPFKSKNASDDPHLMEQKVVRLTK